MTLNTLTYPYHTNTVLLPGNCEVAYVDEGKGERTLLFVHGLANYALVWRKNIDYLRQFYRCIAIDLPGNGLSDKNEHNFSIGFFADTLHHFIQVLDLKNVVLVGHSMGGQVVLTTAIKYPNIAQSLVLCAPAGFERFTALEKAMYSATINMFEYLGGEEHSLRKTIETSFYRDQRQGEGMITELVAQMRTYKGNYYKKMVDACIRSMLAEPVLDKLAEVKIPALVLFGDRDALIPNRLIHHITTEQMAKDATKQMPHGELHMIPDGGHFVQWEKADEVNKDIIHFLEQ